LLEFLADESVRGVLNVCLVICLLFGLYLTMVFFSNRSLRKLADRSRVSREGVTAEPPTLKRAGRDRMFLVIAIGLAGCLLGLLLLINSV
jgi:hypothetical protein